MAKKTKSLTMRLIDMVFSRVDKLSPEEEVAAHLARIRVAPPGDLAGELAAALFAKKTLDTTRQVDDPFPDDYFSGAAPIDAPACAVLMAYAAALEEFRIALLERNTTPSLAVAKGLMTWIASLHTMATPGMLPKGREMWARLAEAGARVEEAHKFLLRREPTEVDQTYFAYRPAIFTAPPH